MRQSADCRTLLVGYQKNHQSQKYARKLSFSGVGSNDVYNITAPFSDEGKIIIAGRVEPRNSEESTICFFEEQNGVWQLLPDMPTFSLQDPFVTWIDGMLIFGGVKVYKKTDGTSGWKTVLYKGKSVKQLVPFFEGPNGMKDLRLAQMPDGKILVMTRPQGVKGGRGKIGYFLCETLDELDIKKIEEAPLLEGLFAKEEWGGANGIYPLKNGYVGILGHVACFDEQGDRHYYSMAFVLDPLTGDHSAVEIIAIRSDFADGPSKRPDLRDIVFSGGAVRDNAQFILFAGTSDTEAHKISIRDPFEKYKIERCV